MTDPVPPKRVFYPASEEAETARQATSSPQTEHPAYRLAFQDLDFLIGLNIVLPHEQLPNPYVTPSLSLQFHYFALRKMHFLLRARAVAVFPGGFGTFDECFELLTLIQTGKVKPLPIMLFGREFWNRVVSFEGLVEEGTISPDDLELFRFVETAEEAWDCLCDHYADTDHGLDCVK